MAEPAVFVACRDSHTRRPAVTCNVLRNPNVPGKVDLVPRTWQECAVAAAGLIVNFHEVSACWRRRSSCRSAKRGCCHTSYEFKTPPPGCVYSAVKVVAERQSHAACVR